MKIKGFIESDELEKMVNNKLIRIGITEKDYPINPYSIIKSEGIMLHEEPFENANIRGMIVHGENATGIIINAKRKYVSRRFIAMHELSHHWFHPHNDKTICFEDYCNNRRGIEWQANNAAAYALMPTSILVKLNKKHNGNIGLMSNELKVSRDSLIYRMQEVELQSDYLSMKSEKSYSSLTEELMQYSIS